MLNFLKSFPPAPPAATAEVLPSSAFGRRPFPACHGLHHRPDRRARALQHPARGTAAGQRGQLRQVFSQGCFWQGELLHPALRRCRLVLCVRAAPPGAVLPMQLQVRAQTPVMETWGNLHREPCSCSSCCWPKLQIWRWLHLVCVLSFSETAGPHISQSTYSSWNNNAQLPGERAGRKTAREKLGFLMTFLCWPPGPQKEAGVTPRWKHTGWEWEKRLGWAFPETSRPAQSRSPYL